MTDIRAILTMDMATLGHWLQRGWSWWTSELQVLLPARMRASFADGPQLVAELHDDNLTFREYRQGAASAIPRSGAAEKLLPRSALALPNSEVLLRETMLPALPMHDLRRMTALDIDRLTPLRADEVVFDLELAPEPAAGGVRRVTIAVARREVLKAMLDAAAALGGEPRTVCLIDRETGVPRFDFLKALRAAEGAPSSLRGIWWVAVLVLLAANVALWVLRDSSSVDALQDEVDAQQTSVVLATAVHHRVEAETLHRRELVARHSQRAPLALLDAVTRALPDGAYIRHFEWNGETLRLTGSATAGIDVATLLDRSARLANARPATQGRAGATGMFDVVVEPKAGGAP
ncbi:MAG: PilN domain-containing protein [Rhizomicrobium sp.]